MASGETLGALAFFIVSLDVSSQRFRGALGLMGSSEQLLIAKVTLRDQAWSVGSGLYPLRHPETIQSHGEDAASWCLPWWDLLPTEACGSWVERS